LQLTDALTYIQREPIPESSENPSVPSSQKRTPQMVRFVSIKELPAAMEIDLHGYHPDDIDISDVVKQAWETGAMKLRLIHGHGRGRGISPGFVNTNTGYFGLRVRATLRSDDALKPCIKRSTLYCGHDGSTTIDLKPNPNPSRTEIYLPERTQREKFRRY
jgi:hypothetical protein